MTTCVESVHLPRFINGNTPYPPDEALQRLGFRVGGDCPMGGNRHCQLPPGWRVEGGTAGDLLIDPKDRIRATARTDGALIITPFYRSSLLHVFKHTGNQIELTTYDGHDSIIRHRVQPIGSYGFDSFLAQLAKDRLLERHKQWLNSKGINTPDPLDFWDD